MSRSFVKSLALTAATVALAAPALAFDRPLSVEDSFRIGSTGVLCTAQNAPADANLQTMFDRGYRIVCRDAASAVGALYALRADGGDPLARLAARRAATVECAPATDATIDGIGAVAVSACKDKAAGVDRRLYAVTRGKTTYVAEGLGGYDSALRLGLAAIVTDRPVAGEVQVATTSAGDPAAFARVQAGTLDPDSALAEAYVRNNSGSYAESSEFFETLAQRQGAAAARNGEYLVNQALQQSNLGNFAAADALFTQAERAIGARDGVTQRMLRNFRAIHLLNQKKPEAALVELDRKVVAMARGSEDNAIADGVISPNLADQINRENVALERLGGIDSRLSPFERAELLDGQALQLRGVALRVEGRNAEARKALDDSVRAIASVRNGRVTSTAWLRSETQQELALIAEAEGNYGAAESYLTEAVRIFEVEHPQSPALLAAKARLAAFLGRRGQTDRALALYGEVVTESASMPGSAATMRDLLQPYFALLIDRAASDPQAAAQMFDASQILQRPGVAQTQAVLARELSEGNDEASALFRLSVTRTREIARTRTEIARLAAKPDATADDQQALADARDALAGLEREQTALQSKLSEYPRYRVLQPQALPLAELQTLLRPGEAYYKLNLVGQDAYALYATATTVRAFRVPATTAALEADVARLRDSIVRLEDGAPVTYPFDAALARKLFVTLFGPVEGDLAAAKHLIFEPDGPMLQLPPNLLIAEQAGVDAYKKRIARPNADEFDFRGIAWLGRNRDVSIAVSPRSFADVRAIAPSAGSKGYLGLGENARPSLSPTAVAEWKQTESGDCGWPLATWENPISPAELTLAGGIVGQSRSTVLTGAAFSDTALVGRQDLSDYRIVHFATHGLVTAPRPECPARPALLTSFGSGGSDGLLSFKEIYDLRLDADVVILSACDTAGMATVAATREAGITTGGNFALDGLVRAFVGAGARSVVASHWPVPDDYDATKRLISGMFRADAGSSMASALRAAQQGLMDDVNTSHPYYWSAFTIVGDGSRPLLKP
ncbi:CHAT domain-containing protein [Sphingomonas laterariae]|uniref:CHAT domain-containing protein n=1 Tax=Edaphosphingomonas laterariae TaxID=861865 RepID=A0A239HJS0_9SPHN|nr:CHAT domain-containing tetratricopeptide repeat protein [Sphingomonas laterariae]SNS81649.1 CHAT domain-containing protein [Sphingomonas laterariae]